MKDHEEYQERDEIYYKNLPLWPDFDIYDKHIDGLIPSSHLTSWEKFHEVLKYYRKDELGSEYIFRGQHNYQWKLQPTLDRMTAGAIQKRVADKQLKNFRLSIRGRVDNRILTDSEDEELWAVGQHHGLATPLLDWTLAPYVALFFAFLDEDSSSWVDEDKQPTNHSRVIYILNKSFLEDLDVDINLDPLDSGYPKIVEPSVDDHGRLVNQAGLFTMAPYGETIESALLTALVDSDVNVDDPSEVSKYICRLHLPNSPEFRLECLRHLRDMNIHYASLFPDVIGASGYCNELIRETIKGFSNITVNVTEQAPISTATFTNDHAQKDQKETSQILRKLLLSLTVDPVVKRSVTEKELLSVSKHAFDFVENHAGIDWFILDSSISRLKTIIRRGLIKINFPEDKVLKATSSLALRLAEMSYEKNTLKRVQEGSLLDSAAWEKRFNDIWKGIDHDH